MIRHIVMWKLASTEDAERATVTREIIRLLEGLAAVVPGLTSLEVTTDLGDDNSNYDLVLVSEHVSQQALVDYQEHPAHRAASLWIREHVSARACVDTAL
ncbi:MAG: Dabb family protein [Microbacteriaceae bacterium]